MSNLVVANTAGTFPSSGTQVEARVGENGELILPTPGGFTAIGLKPGATVYISMSPPLASQGYGTGQPPIIIVNSEPKKAEEKKKRSEVFKRL